MNIVEAKKELAKRLTGAAHAYAQAYASAGRDYDAALIEAQRVHREVLAEALDFYEANT